MERVRCLKCGSEGYTASPRFAKCSCGGRTQEIIDSKIDEFRSMTSANAFLRRLEVAGKYPKLLAHNVIVLVNAKQGRK